MKRPQVLIVGSSTEAAEYLQGSLSSYSISSMAVASGSEALRLLRERQFYAVVFALDEMAIVGQKVLANIQRDAPNTASIVITEGTDHPALAEWAAAGAFECLSKPLDRSAMLAVLHRALTRNQLCAGSGFAPPNSRQRKREWPFAEIIGDSEAMQEVFHSITKVAQSDVNICLYGESGTGKELVARAIHESGRRQGHPFVALDCATIPEGLMESEMFGHVRGAFTSAVGDRVGVFQAADIGTLFLDEVAELPLPLQAKLLRVIQNREFRRVGSNHPIRVDVHILAATNRDLADLIKRGLFREDLFYRLDVINITIPPLRKRKEDIPLLVEHFIKEFNRNSNKQIWGVSARTMRLLLKYNWPGNVRELQNCIERAGVMVEGNIIELADVRQVLHPNFQTGILKEQRSTLREREKALVLDALRQTRGNRTAAAVLLGVSLRGLHYKLKRLSAASPGETDEHPFPLTEHPKKQRRENHGPLARPNGKKRRRQANEQDDLLRPDPHC